MLTKREVYQKALAFEEVPYTPWTFGFTREAREKLIAHYGKEELNRLIAPHSTGVGDLDDWQDLGNDMFRDLFGVVWDRSVEKDIGQIHGAVLPEPTLEGYSFPDPKDPRWFCRMEKTATTNADRYRVFHIGFSLYERAWTLRGMENLLMDFVEEPDFVHELMTAIADFNIAVVQEAVKNDVDAVYFGDDWGQQHGLIMGGSHWHTFIYPQLKRMYGAVREAGKKVVIHSCGDVDELFEDLIEIGLNSFNPFQPEVMDVFALHRQYHGRLAFHGGLSTQKALPYGTPEDVRRETRKLLAMGRKGGYIFAPAHAVEGDVPLENMIAFIEEVNAQPGYRENCN